MASVTSFLEDRLRLKVNRQKSAVAPVGNVSSSAIVWDAAAHLASGAKSGRAKDRLREITRRNGGTVPWSGWSSR